MQKRTELERKKPGAKSMFADEKFDLLRKTFTENNPKLANDPKAIEKEMNGLEKNILGLLKEKPEDFESAILILIQGLNFLARFSGVSEFLTPDFEKAEEEIAPSPPIESKHNAVFVADKESGPFYLSLAKVFETTINPDALRYKFYTDAKKLLKNIIEGSVCGVVAFQLNAHSSVEGHLRHDLKYMPGFNYESAKKYVFPVCLDFAPPHQVFEIVGIMAKLQDGSYQPAKQVDDFSLSDALSNLVAHMYIPAQKIKILVVDDIPKEVAGMEVILDAWPNLERSTVIQLSEREMPDVPDNTDILLLDEGMKITGTQVATHLQQNSKFSGLVASTTGGDKPNYTRWHFDAKNSVAKKYSTAKEFVLFVNSLLQTI